jgi:hypothetical protein
MSQKTPFFIVIAVKTSNLTELVWLMLHSANVWRSIACGLAPWVVAWSGHPRIQRNIVAAAVRALSIPAYLMANAKVNRKAIPVTDRGGTYVFPARYICI